MDVRVHRDLEHRHFSQGLPEPLAVIISEPPFQRFGSSKEKRPKKSGRFPKPGGRKSPAGSSSGCVQGVRRIRPATSETTNSTRKMKNNTLAISAAPAAIPVKPKTAATIATMKNTNA